MFSRLSTKMLQKASTSSSPSMFSQYKLPDKMPKHTEPGQIHLIAGPMFSGKTTELFRLCNRHSLAKRKVIVVKYARDKRYDDVLLCTHDLRKMDAIAAVCIEDVFDELMEHDVIGIDEGQFFEDVCEMSERLANSGKTVIVSALNSDYKREPFMNVSRLFALAEKVDKLNAVCRFCGASAPFTLRTVRCEKREVIGGQDMYQAACRHCYHSLHETYINVEKHLEGSVPLGGGAGADVESPTKEATASPQRQKDGKPLQELNNTRSSYNA